MFSQKNSPFFLGKVPHHILYVAGRKGAKCRECRHAARSHHTSDSKHFLPSRWREVINPCGRRRTQSEELPNDENRASMTHQASALAFQDFHTLLKGFFDTPAKSRLASLRRSRLEPSTAGHRFDALPKCGAAFLKPVQQNERTSCHCVIFLTLWRV